MAGPRDDGRLKAKGPREHALFGSFEAFVSPAREVFELRSPGDAALANSGTMAEPKRQGEAKEASWYAVGRLTELTEGGARGAVWRTFADIDAAKLYRDKHRLALFPGTFQERPAERSTVEVSRGELEGLLKKGQGKELAHQFRVLEWAREQGTYYEHGLWYDRGQEPRLGQVVHFTMGLDYRDEPEERRVFPSQPLDAGTSEKPQHVVFEKIPGKPLLGRIVSLPSGPEAAKAEVRSLDEKRLSLEPAAMQRQWMQFEAGSEELRAIAYGERVAPPVTEPEKPVQRPEVEPVRVTTHEKGRCRAEVVERMGEGGQPQLAVLLSKDVTQADGLVRTDGTVLSVDDVREVHGALERYREEMLERARQQERLVPERREPKITTHEKGRHRAQVVERMGEDGQLQRTVLLSKEVREADGRVRTVGTVLDLDDVREVRRAMEQHREQMFERTRQQERQPVPRPGRYVEQGISMQL